VSRIPSLENWGVSTQEGPVLCASRQRRVCQLRYIILSLSMQGRPLSMVFLIVLFSAGSLTWVFAQGDNLVDDVLAISL